MSDEAKPKTRAKGSQKPSAPKIKDRAEAYHRAIAILEELQGRIGAGTLSSRLRQEGHVQVFPRVCLMWKEDWMARKGIKEIPRDGPKTELGIIGQMAHIMDEMGFVAAPRERLLVTAGDLSDFASEAMAHARDMMMQGRVSFEEVVRLGLEAAASASDLEHKAIDLAMREADAKRHENGEPLEGEVLPPLIDNPKLAATLKVLES